MVEIKPFNWGLREIGVQIRPHSLLIGGQPGILKGRVDGFQVDRSRKIDRQEPYIREVLIHLLENTAHGRRIDDLNETSQGGRR